ncbi:hypothetical protein [Spiroplasma litorale]|nr:hypothetical protein [Spiroplasma litorale]
MRISLSLSLRNERAWVIINLSSLIIVSILSFGYSNYSSNFVLLPPQIICLSLIPAFISGGYFALYLSNLKESSLLKRMKFVGIKRYSIIFSFIICSSIFTIIGFCLSLLWVYIMSTFQLNLRFSNLSNLLWWNWVWVILALILIQIVVFCTSVAIMDVIKYKSFRPIVPVILVTFLALFSDVLIPSFITTSSGFLTYFGYLSLTKYMSWLILMTSSFSFVDYEGGIYQVINDKDSYVFISNIYALLILSIIITSTTVFLSIWFFKWK